MPSQTDIIKQRKQRNMERTESESEIVQVPHLDYMEQTHTTQVLSQLHQMHRRDQFCDAKLIVGDHETCIHRAVLASASSFFFKMFEKGVEDDKNQAMFKLKDVGWDEFKYLLDYIYTGRLDVPDNKVKAVYRLSQDLRIHSATRVCVAYLTSCLTPDNCLGIRTFAADEAFKREINMYISDNIRDVTCSKKFYGLTRISLEIVVPSEHQINMANHEEILPEVLRCLKQKIEASKNKVEPLTEDMMVMYLNSDNSLTDCNDVDDATVQENEVVQDYKKLTKKKMSGFTPSKDQSTSTLSPEANGTSNYRKFSIEPSTSRPNYEQESSIVASYKTKDRSYMVIAMLNSNLVTISIHYRPAVSSGSGTEDPDSPVNSNSVHSMFNGSPEEQLASMSTNRCAFGLKVLDDKLFACGGYDRGECLKSVEMYDIKTNKWTAVSDMKSARGRFSIGLYKNKVYACGGSSGNHDMKTVECYDPETDKWQVVCDAPRGKASPGIAVVQGKLYVIGGCIGQTTSSSCETLDLETNEWKSIAPMRIPRFQEAVVVFRNKIYVIGGTNGWKCLNEVEVYDPQTDEWTNAPGLNIGRRGAGVEVYNGKIYLVGGNDGQSALNSVEVYDPETHTWSVGPTLSCHRANCGVAILDDRMFAVGGFNGKKFLNSVESLDMKELDFWNICVPNSDVLEVTLDDNSTDSEVGANGDMCTQNDDVNCLCGDGPKVVKKKLGLVISKNNGAALTDTADIAGNATCNGGESIKVDSERPS